MNSSPHFEPIFPSHAVERCSAMIIFSEELPSKVFQKVIDRAQINFRAAGLQLVTGASFGFQLDTATGQTTPLAGPGPSVFTTADRATQFIFAQNSVTVRTTRYVRWEPFAGQIEELTLPLIGTYVDVVAIRSLQLDYVDRFLWSGDWSSFDWRKLLRTDGNFVAAKASNALSQWHCHSGWFEDIADGRRLVNVNVDVADFAQPAGPVPSVGILTLMRDEVPGPPFGSAVRYGDAPSVQTGLDQLHNDLKMLLEQIITDPMAQRIGLKPRTSNVPPH